MAAGIRESLNLAIDQATTAAIRQKQIGTADLDFEASDKNISCSTPTIQ